MEEKRFTKKQKNVIVVMLLVLVSLIGGITYAYFRAQGTSGEQTITTANLSLTFGDGSSIVNATNISPIEEADILTKATKKTFTVAKASNSKDIYANIELTNITIPNELKNYDFKWALYEGSNKITTGNFATLGTDTNIVMATNQLINSTTAKTYNLYIWINETEKDQSTMMNKTFKGTIKVSGSDKQTNTLSSNILKGTINENMTTTKTYAKDIESYHSGSRRIDTTTLLSKTYDFDTSTGKYSLSGDIKTGLEIYDYSGYYTCYSRGTTCASTLYYIRETTGYTVKYEDYYNSGISQTDKGLFVQKDDSQRSEYGFPTYYYRGYITNNYVEFGTHKNDVTNNIYTGSYSEAKLVALKNSPIKWRIVRINEDGSIRLISENSITTSEQMWSSSESLNYNNSDIKTANESWFNNTLIENDLLKNIQVGNFCNEVTDITNRLSEYKPSFKCSTSGNLINEKVGLISIDEVYYAGVVYSNIATASVYRISYINNKTSFNTMSTYDKYVLSFYPYYDSYRSININSGTNAIRAVINLKPNVLVASGTGTSADPYIIK